MTLLSQSQWKAAAIPVVPYVAGRAHLVSNKVATTIQTSCSTGDVVWITPMDASAMVALFSPPGYYISLVTSNVFTVNHNAVLGGGEIAFTIMSGGVSSAVRTGPARGDNVVSPPSTLYGVVMYNP